MMMLLVLLLLVALGLTIGAAMSRAPLWTAVFVLVLTNLLVLLGPR